MWLVAAMLVGCRGTAAHAEPPHGPVGIFESAGDGLTWLLEIREDGTFEALLTRPGHRWSYGGRWTGRPTTATAYAATCRLLTENGRPLHLPLMVFGDGAADHPTWTLETDGDAGQLRLSWVTIPMRRVHDRPRQHERE
jgi:hypothetical protein